MSKDKREPPSDAICFQAVVNKVQTLVDGGIRLTLDLAESEIKTAASMMECKQRGAVLEVAAVPIEQEKNNKYGL